MSTPEETADDKLIREWRENWIQAPSTATKGALMRAVDERDALRAELDDAKDDVLRLTTEGI